MCNIGKDPHPDSDFENVLSRINEQSVQRLSVEHGLKSDAALSQINPALFCAMFRTPDVAS